MTPIPRSADVLNVHCTAPYIHLLKALMRGNNALGAQWRGCSFTLCHALLEMGILLHKEATVSFILNTGVCTCFQIELVIQAFVPTISWLHSVEIQGLFAKDLEQVA